jgi:hypothetical protein
MTAEEAALAGLDSDISGGEGGAGAYLNQVYLGAIQVPAVKGVLRGKKINTGKTYADKTITRADAKKLYLTDGDLRGSWEAKLRSLGQNVTKVQARALWDLSVDGASDWYSTSNGKQKVTPQEYIEWYVGGSKSKQNIPTRQIYKTTPEQIYADVNDIASTKLMRSLTEEDRQAQWYKDLTKAINDMVNQGTVTTTKQVKNPKTGKLETQVIQTPGVTKEGIEAKITGALETADPESAARAKRLSFIKWLYGQMGNQMEGRA